MEQTESLASPGRANLPTPVIHKSAHPKLPPAQPEQVVQFLLARNYYLTALELLVESQQAGHGDEVPELQLFFSDHEKFPPDELAKHQNATAMDVQAQAREREERLQLAEYELRLAKEDLEEMRKRMERMATQPAAGAAQPREDSEAAPHERQRSSMPIPPEADDPAVAGHLAAAARKLCAAEPTSEDIKAINCTIISYLLHNNMKLTAMTFNDEVAAMSSVMSMSVRGAQEGSAGGSEVEGADTGVDLWRWLQASKAVQRAAAMTSVAGSCSELVAEEDQHEEVARERAEREKLERELQAHTQLVASLRLKLEESERRRTEEALAGAALLSAGARSGAGGYAAREEEGAEGAAQKGGAAAEGPPVDPEHHAALQSIVSQLTDMLPRLMPNVTSKSRLEVLPLILLVITSSSDPGVQRHLVGLVLNLVGSPDANQRAVIMNALVSLAQQFGSSWVAVELLPMCVKQVTHPSSERRTLIAELLGLLSGMLDLSTQAHVVLTQLHRLTEDRIEQVREAAVLSVSALLGRLQFFSKSYYQVVEDMLLQLARDNSESISDAVASKLLPALQAWSTDVDVVTTSLLPKVITEMARYARQATAQHTASQAAPASAASITFSGASLSYTAGTVSAAAAAAAAIQVPSKSSGGGAAPRRFPNHDFQVMYQLLALYIKLQPTLRHSALRNCPAWALTEACAPLGSAGPSLGTIGSVIVRSTTASSLGSTSGDGCPAGPEEEGGGAASSTEAAATEAGASGQVPLPPLPPHAALPAGTASSALPGSEGGAHHQRQQQAESSSTSQGLPIGRVSTFGSMGGATPGHSRQASVHVQHLPVVDATERLDVDADALFAAWAGAEHHMQWKSIQWVVQFLIPELLDAIKLVGVTPDTLHVRRQLAQAMLATCNTFGPGFSRSVVLPLMIAAAGAYQIGQPSGPTHVLDQPVPTHLQESALDLMPRAPEAARLSRERVLPQLLAGVLPGCALLGEYLGTTMSASDTLVDRWVLEMLPEFTAAITFVCEVHSQQHMAELLQVLEKLVSKRSTASGLCGVAVARGLLPVAGQEQMGRRIMPSLMVLLSQGDHVVQLACVVALLEVLLRFGDDTKLAEQVFVVYDGLLEQGAHDVQLAVLACGLRLASSVAALATRSAAAAMQLEWLLHAAQSLSMQLQGLTPQLPRTPEQQRTLAGTLVSVVQTVHVYDVRLPRLQSALQGCIEGLQKCRNLLTDAQLSALSAMHKERPSGPGGSVTDSHRTNSHTAPAPYTAGVQPSAPSIVPGQPQHVSPGGFGRVSLPADVLHASIQSAGAASSAGAGGAMQAASNAPEPGGMRARFENFKRKLTQKKGSEDANGGGGVLAAVSAGAPAPQRGGGSTGGLPPMTQVSGVTGLKYTSSQQ